MTRRDGVAELRGAPDPVDLEEQREAIAFLKWLWDNRFAFLGVRSFDYSNEDGKVKFKRLRAPLLVRKIVVGAGLLVLSATTAASAR